MPKKHKDRSNKSQGIIIICTIVIAATVTGLWLLSKPKTDPSAGNAPEKVHLPIKHQSVIDYNELEKDNELQGRIQKRKAEYSVDKGIDIIANADESLKIGDATVSMQEILDTIRLENGDVVEKDIEPGSMDPKLRADKYGIYVVQPGDNIWNVHFRFLKDYLHHKGITLSPLADEPNRRGVSSGVGKILKFSEKIVHIYNIKERKLDTEINLILPLYKRSIYRP